MTCIAAITDRQNKKIFMMGDTQRTSSSYSSFDPHEKIWLHTAYGRNWLLGHTGSQLCLQVCRYVFEWGEEAPSGDIYEFLIRVWRPRLQTALKEQLCYQKLDGIEQVDQNLMVGVEGRIFMFDKRLAITEFEEPFAAIGSGSAVAMGSLGTTEGMDLSPGERLKLALRETTKYCTGVGGRHDLLTI